MRFQIVMMIMIPLIAGCVTPQGSTRNAGRLDAVSLGDKALARRDTATARSLYSQALYIGRGQQAIRLAAVLIAENRPDAAKRQLDIVKAEMQDSLLYQEALARLAFAGRNFTGSADLFASLAQNDLSGAGKWRRLGARSLDLGGFTDKAALLYQEMNLQDHRNLANYSLHLGLQEQHQAALALITDALAQGNAQDAVVPVLRRQQALLLAWQGKEKSARLVLRPVDGEKRAQALVDQYTRLGDDPEQNRILLWQWAAQIPWIPGQ